jgi:hypothetical protein
MMVILLESLLAAGILFYVLIKGRAKTSRWEGIMMRMPHMSWDRVNTEVRRHRARHVILLVIYAFCAGLGTGLFIGSRSCSRISAALALYATACSILVTFVLGYLLDRALREAEKDRGGSPPDIKGG